MSERLTSERVIARDDGFHPLTEEARVVLASVDQAREAARKTRTAERTTFWISSSDAGSVVSA